MYSFDSRIRYSETDPEGKLKIEALIDYFQDCCSFQSEEGGVGLQYTREHHIAWLVNFWQIEILRRPVLGEWVRTTTIPYDFKAFIGYRNCTMETLPERNSLAENAADGQSHYLAWSNSVWSLIDLDKGLPVRIPPEMFKAYPLDPKIDMEYLSRKIPLPRTAEAAREADIQVTRQEPVAVTASMIDSNHHVNNGQYVRLALSFFREENAIRRICVEYVRQAREGDVIVPVIYEGSMRTVALCSQADGKPFAIVQVQFKGNQ